ncbi:MAG: hypothetical protein L3J32_05480, partial [Rhizobiaceae bacterium]|nr:hypothetical protein [Rhizobiaceae bacterium]
ENLFDLLFFSIAPIYPILGASGKPGAVHQCFGICRKKFAMEGHNFERLKAHILPLSVSRDFNIARTEWDLIGVEVSDEFDNCPCGQDIKEHCYIKNVLSLPEF